MRQRTNMNGLVWHVKSSGEAYQSGRNKCEQKLKKIEKLIEQGYELTHVEKRQPKAVITTVFGKEVKVTIEVFKKRYEPCGFKVVTEIY